MSLPGRAIAAAVACGLVLSSCRGADPVEERAAVATETADAADDATGVGYEFELTTPGDGARFVVVAPLPVGRSADVTVVLASDGETIAVELEAEVVAADAEQAVQEIDLRIVEVRADDPRAVDVLESIVGASSVLRRDRRQAVFEQTLDIPPGLGFRADAVARQVLRAPFSLAGPVALAPVGAGANWSVTTMDGDVAVDERDVAVEFVNDDGYTLRFSLPDGEVEIQGRTGALLPDLQVITLADAEIRVEAERS